MFSFLNPKVSGFGIDLSDLSIKIVNLQKQKQGVVLATFGRQEIKEGLIEEGEIKNEQALIETIKKAVATVQGKPLKTKFCVVSLPETESYLRIVPLPTIKKEEVAEAIKWEIEAHIPLALEEIYFDWQIIEPSHPQVQRPLEVLVGVLPKKAVDPYLRVLKEAGLKPFVFEIESVATARALIKNNFSQQPIMILDIGAERTSLIIFCGQTVYFTASLPISNNYLTAALSEKLKIDRAKARQIKFKIGLDYQHPDKPVFQALRPPLVELAAKIKEYISFYQEHTPVYYLGGQISQILLCGGGATMADLPDFLSDELKLPVRLGNPWVNILSEPSEEILGLPLKESLAYTTALGLALRSCEETK